MDALGGKPLGRAQCLAYLRTIGDDRQVVTAVDHLRFADWHHIVAGGHIALQRTIKRFGLKIDHRVVVADGGQHQPFGVGGGGRRNHFQAGAMDKPGFGVLAVEGAGTNPAIARCANYPRYRSLPAVVVGRRILDNAVKGGADKIGELHLNHWPQAHQRHAGGCAHKGCLTHGHVEDSSGPELFFQPFGYFKGTTKAAPNIFAHHQHIRIARHRFAQGFADRRNVGELAAAIIDLFGRYKAKVAADGRLVCQLFMALGCALAHGA